MVKVYFEVRYNTEFGQNVTVVGESPELGRWDPRKGMRMKYHPPGIWNLTVDIPLKIGEDLVYKYCILDDRQKDGGIPYWEPSLDHHRKVKDTSDIECNDIWGAGKQLQEIFHTAKTLSPTRGKLFRGPMPYSSAFDPHQTVYAELYEKKVDVIVCLSYRDECEIRTGFDLLAQYGKDSLPVIYFPIDDFKTPKPGDTNYVSRLVDRIEELLSKGLNVVVHCHAGIGRTGLLISLWAKRYLQPHGLLEIPEKYRDDTLPEVIQWTRSKIRGAVQTNEQIGYAESFPV